MWHRLKPALSLVLLAPLIAEYLLGSLSFRQLVIFPIMALMYGAGALLVREVTRRTGRGWPTIILLGLAYAVIEEGLATQSLFNPHYLGLHLLDYGFIPALGIGAPWTVYVVVLHVAWSIVVPIGLVESLFPDRRTTPWRHRLCAGRGAGEFRLQAEGEVQRLGHAAGGDRADRGAVGRGGVRLLSFPGKQVAAP
jgi:uncharacterized membrane protein YcfT